MGHSEQVNRSGLINILWIHSKKFGAWDIVDELTGQALLIYCGFGQKIWGMGHSATEKMPAYKTFVRITTP